MLIGVTSRRDHYFIEFDGAAHRAAACACGEAAAKGQEVNAALISHSVAYLEAVGGVWLKQAQWLERDHIVAARGADGDRQLGVRANLDQPDVAAGECADLDAAIGQA